MGNTSISGGKPIPPHIPSSETTVSQGKSADTGAGEHTDDGDFVTSQGDIKALKPSFSPSSFFKIRVWLWKHWGVHLSPKWQTRLFNHTQLELRWHKRTLRQVAISERKVESADNIRLRHNFDASSWNIPMPRKDALSHHPLDKLLSSHSTFKPLGSGGFGAVDAIYPKKAGKLFASKQQQGKHHAMIKHEHSLLKSMNHPNIVKVSDELYPDTDELSDRPFSFYMEDAGRPVNGVLNSIDNKPLPPVHMRSIAHQALSALSYLKEQQVIHRDLKSSNVLMNPSNGVLTLIDFGLAEKVDAVLPMHNVSGTIPFMAPEVLQHRCNPHGGTEITPASDLYSLGLVLLELTTQSNNFPDPPELHFSRARLQQLESVNPKDFLNREIMNKLAGRTGMDSAEETKYISALTQLLTGLLAFNPEDRISHEDALKLVKQFPSSPALPD